MSRSTASGGAALVPTGRALKSYGCFRSLSRAGVHTVVASEHERLPQHASRYCDEVVHLDAGPGDLRAYRDALLAVAARPDVETAYPTREADVFLFAKYAERFREHVSLVVPDAATLARAHDRLQLAHEAEAAGVPYADTRRLSDVEDWNRPTVVKSRYNVLTGDYVEGMPAGTLREVKQVNVHPPGAAPDGDALRAAMGHDPIVQAFVPQAEKVLYTALWDDGHPVSTYHHRQIRQNSWVGGGGVYRESVHEPGVERVATALLERLGWNGLACIEYVRDADTDEWKFLEINPRLWQSLPEAVRAGVDFPLHYWRLARGETGPFDDEYADGQRCHIAYGELAHYASLFRDESPLLERPSVARRAWEIASSCVTHPRFDYLRADDPWLALAGIRETLVAGVTPSRNFVRGDGPDEESAPVDADEADERPPRATGAETQEG